MENLFFEKLSKIRGFIFGFEGVFTSNKLLILNNGEKLREVNNTDAFALALAVQKRYRIAVILNEESEGITMWLNSLGVHDVFKQSDSRQASYESFVIENGLNLMETIFVGADINDFTSMKLAGVSASPLDAVPEIKSAANYICEVKGGEGCPREIIRLVLKAQNQWDWY